MSKTATAIFVILATAGALCAQGTRPSGNDVSDAWLGPAVLEELKACKSADDYAALNQRLAAVALARLSCGQVDKLEALTDVIYAIQACNYLPLAEKVTGDKTLSAWLLANRDVARRLYRAAEDVRKPQEPFERLRDLIAADEKAVQAYPDLAVAFATALRYRMLDRSEQPTPASMVESFRYYTNPKASFRYDLKAMPYELSRFLADTRLSLGERQWAVANYGNAPNPARCYFDIRYDTDYYRKGDPKKIASLPYSLPNIKQVGGVCLEQAYFSAEVCKALGIPAVIVTGDSNSGISHAWLAALKITNGGKEAVWDCSTGRYEQAMLLSGSVANPATGGVLPDSELMLAGMAAQLPLQRREEADAATLLAKLVDLNLDKPVAPEVLQQLAEAYNARFAKAGRPPAAVGWIKPVRKLDGALVEDLIEQAVNANLAHHPAWDLIITLRKQDRLSVAHLDRFFDLLITRTSKKYPEYSASMLRRIIPTIPDATKRENVYQKAITAYAARPDLAGRLLLALGDDYAKQDKKDKALNTYTQTATRCVSVAEVAVDAAARADALYVEANRRDLAIKLYEGLMAKTPKSKIADVFQRQSAYYQLGKRLAELLTDAGQPDAAKRVLTDIGAPIEAAKP